MSSPFDTVSKSFRALHRDDPLILQLAEIAESDSASPSERLDAIELIGERLGIFPERVIH